MVSTIASMAVLVSANVAPALKSMDAVGDKVKDVGQTSQKEGAKTEGFMKRWGSSFAVIGAAAVGALYAVIKASPLLAGAMQEAQDAISLLFMTIGDALESVIRPFVDLLWGLTDTIIKMPAPLDAITSSAIVLGPALVGVGIAIKAIGTSIVLFGIPLATFLGGFGLIIFAAGLVAAALYYLTEDPMTAIMGAFATIGIGAGILMHNPAIAAISGIVAGFVILVTASDDTEVAIGLAFAAIGVAATALMGHPALAVGIGIAAALITWGKASDEAKDKMVAAFTAIGLAASVLLANPVIAALVLVTDAVYVLIRAYEKLQRLMGAKLAEVGAEELALGRGYPALYPYWQQGGYVPFTAPAILHAGEYVVPAGRVGMGGGGAVYNVTNNFEINDPVLGSDMDIDRLKQRLDYLYKSEMAGVP